MVEEKKGTTLEQLTDKVHSGLDLVSDEELAILFEEAEKSAQGTPRSQDASQVSSDAPPHAETTPPVVEASKGQASLLERVPEKFKGSDEAATLDKILKALQDAETALTQSNQERSQLQNIVQDLTRRPREEYRPQPQQAQPQQAVKQQEEEDFSELDNLDDSAVFDKASEIIQKVRKEAKKVAREVAKEEATKSVQHYDTFATRRAVLERFKEQHSDFDNFRQEIVEVCRLHPEWDNDLNGLPRIYEAAKTLAIAKAKAINPQTQPSQQNINIEELKAQIKAEVEASAFEKARQAIIEEVKKRKAASGILTSSSASTSSDRLADSSRTTPMSPEDKVIDEMLKSGPKSLGI